MPHWRGALIPNPVEQFAAVIARRQRRRGDPGVTRTTVAFLAPGLLRCARNDVNDSTGSAMILDAGKRLAHFGGKFLPQPWRLRLVKGGCLIEFVFRLREKANDHGFRYLAKTSSASRAAVSPAK